MNRRSLLLAATAVGAVVASGRLGAQPASSSRVITIYVPYPAGGISDAQARTIAPHLSKAMNGATVVVENLTGASGSIAAQRLLSAPADGHALMVVSPSETILAPLTIAGLKYNAEDFRLLANGIAAPTALLVRPTLDVNNVNQLIAYSANAANRELTAGNVGVGSMPQLIAEDFRQRTGSRLLHVPYRGGAPMLGDLMANQIDMALMPFAGPILGMVATGKLKLIGIASPTRMAAYPNHPYLNDHPALKDFNYPTWSTFAVSKAVPDVVVTRLNTALGEIMQLPDVQAWVKAAGSFVPETLSVAGSAAFYAAEIKKIRSFARAINLQPQ